MKKRRNHDAGFKARVGVDVPQPYDPFVQAYFQSLRSATEKTQARDVAQAD